LHHLGVLRLVHHEPQLKWLNLVFLTIYGFGIIRYFVVTI